MVSHAVPFYIFRRTQNIIVYKNGTIYEFEEDKTEISSFCNDYSFWRNNCHDENNSHNILILTNFNSNASDSDVWKQYYSPVSLCDTYKENITKNNNSELCLEKPWLGTEFYFCKESKTCIPNSQICDGSVQCFFGEDESFEECKNTFPKGATFECLEANQSYYNITIYATPCDGIIECKNGEDENCEWQWIYTFLPVLFIYVLVTICWCYSYFLVYQNMIKEKQGKRKINRYDYETQKSEILSQIESDNYVDVYGNDLALLKVNLYLEIVFVHFWLNNDFFSPTEYYGS